MSAPQEPARTAAHRRLALRAAWVRLREDTLYRNSASLMLNTAVGAALGALFMVAATRTFPTDQVGLLTSSVSASVLLATVATLGLPNALVRFLPARPQAAASLCAASLLLSAGTAVAVFALSRSLPVGMPMARPGSSGTLVLLSLAILLVLVTNMVVDAAFIARRSAHVLVVKNVVGGVVKVSTLLVLEPGGVTDLAVAHLAGTAVSAAIALAWLVRGLPPPWRPTRASLTGIWSFSLPNTLAMVAGSTPMTVTPLVVLDLLGAREAAYVGIDLMLLSLVNVVPQTISVSFFAELSNEPDSAGHGLRRAVRGLYGLLVPAVAVMLVVVPLVLHIFGPDYVRAGAGCLRWLVAGSLVAAVNYVVDASVNGRGDGGGYLFLNVANAALVLAGVALGARTDLTRAGLGWTVAQAVSAVVGVAYMRLTRLRNGTAGARAGRRR